MGSKSKISRKNFIKSGSAFLSLLSVGMAGAASATTKNEATAKGTFNEDNPDSSSAPSATRRGSWVQKSAMQKGDIGLITSTVKCSIVVDAKENTAVQQAARFLAADMEKITGYKPAIVNSPDDKNPNILISTLANKDSTEQLKGKAEAYRIETKNNNVLLVGSDFRGTAFAVYALCERLGIDPLYHWTGYQPQKVNELVIKKTTYYQDEPTFKYRGFFHDDEDVLPRPFDKYGYPLRIGDVPLEWYQRFFETTLRLGMNMTAPYVRVHRRYEVQKCASDWGLYFTSHHYDILLSNPFGIERFRLAEKRGVSTDWDWYKNKDNMIKYWRGGVEENKDLSAVWPVGLRGTDDHAYEFPQGTSEQEQAAVFRDAIDVQVKTVKQLGKEKNPAFHFTLYTEMLEKFQKHRDTFSVPDNVILVWPDDNEGLMRGLPDNKGKWKHGVYYHLAYYGNVVSKQGPHVVSPYRVADEFKKIVNAGATEFLLVNVTEMREFIMEARMIAEICWDKSLLKAANTADNYVNWWANEYFGSAPAASIFNSYQQYYKLYNTPAITWFANDLVQEALDKLHQKIAGKKFAPIKAETLKQAADQYSAYQSAIAAVQATGKKLNREQGQYFFEHVEFGLLTVWRPLQSAMLLIKALDNNDNNIWALINDAMQPLEQLEIAILRAERPPFDKWYRETWIKNAGSPLNLHRAYNQLREFISCGGINPPVKSKLAAGHNIEGAKLWNDYMEHADKIKPTY